MEIPTKYTNSIPKDFDWLIILNELKEGQRKLSFPEYMTLMQMASNWPTCACGQLCKTLKRDEGGIPRDLKLRALGIKFNEHVRQKCWHEALACFENIEARTTLLLEKQYGKGTISTAHSRAHSLVHWPLPGAQTGGPCTSNMDVLNSPEQKENNKQERKTQ